MKKKTYQKPTVGVIRLQSQCLLAGSDHPTYEQPKHRRLDLNTYYDDEEEEYE